MLAPRHPVSFRRFRRILPISSPSPTSKPSSFQTFQHSIRTGQVEAIHFRLPNLATRHSSLATIPFRIRTYEKSTRNPFRIRTSKTQDFKPFRMNTYKKTGEGVGQWDSHSWLSSCSFASHGTLQTWLGTQISEHASQVTSHGSRPSTAARLLAERDSSVTRIPCLGRSVIDASGTTGCPSTSRNRYCCAMVASVSAISISANEVPMHWRGPPPKGKYANLGIRFSRSPSHRSGRNSSGASYHLASRCTVHCVNETPDPFGTAYPAISRSSMAVRAVPHAGG